MLPRPSDPSRSTQIFAGALILGMAAALAYHGILHSLGFEYPWDTFLFTPVARFSDWFTSVAPAATHDPYLQKGGGAYFPFAYIALLMGNVSSQTLSLAIFKSVAAALIGTGVFLFWQNSSSAPSKNRQGIHSLVPLALIALLNYPLWFGLDRGNIDLWLGGLCLIYVAELDRPRSWVGALALGIAIALKGYPLALMLLGLRQRRYGQTALALLIALGLTLFALSQFHSGVAPSWEGFRKGQQVFWLENVIGSASLNGTSDPYNGLRALVWIVLHAKQELFSTAPVEVTDLQHIDLHAHAKFLNSVSGGADLTGPRVLFAKAYGVLVLLGAAITAFFVLFVDAPRWRRVLAVTLIAILYPNLAGDYKLFVLLPAVYTLLADWDGSKACTRAFWLLALLMIPKAYLYFYGLSITMVLNPVLLLALWWTAISDISAWRKGLAGTKDRIGWYLLRPSSHEAAL